MSPLSPESESEPEQQDQAAEQPQEQQTEEQQADENVPAGPKKKVVKKVKPSTPVEEESPRRAKKCMFNDERIHS